MLIYDYLRDFRELETESGVVYAVHSFDLPKGCRQDKVVILAVALLGFDGP